MPLDQQKLLGYSEALAGAGIDIDTVPIVQAHPWDHSAADLVLDAAPDATAILAMADLQAVAVIEEARRRGLTVPGDLSVVGFNNIPEAAPANLTTIDFERDREGSPCGPPRFSGGPVRHETLATTLVIRGTTAPPAKRRATRRRRLARTKPRAG